MARIKEQVAEDLDASPERTSKVPLWYDVQARTVVALNKRALAEHLERASKVLPDADLAAIRQLVQEVTSRLQVADRMAEISTRLRLDTDQFLAALDQLARRTPVESADPARALTSAEETVLREAGSLRSSMPSFDERASTKTELWREQMLSTAMSVKQTAAVLDVTEGRVRQRLQARTLLGIERGGVWLVPRFQFPDEVELTGIDEVLPAFPYDVHPAAVYAFLTNASVDLEIEGEALSPKQWLLAGGPTDAVVELVKGAYTLP